MEGQQALPPCICLLMVLFPQGCFKNYRIQAQNFLPDLRCGVLKQPLKVIR